MKSRLVLLGPPASGKGTLADALHGEFGWPVVSPGAILRAEKQALSPLGVEAARLTSEGRLLPDEVINDLIGTWLGQRSLEAFVFDGYPRTVGQAEYLEQALATRGSSIDATLLLEASVESLQDRVLNRVACSRCGYTVRMGEHLHDLSGKCPRCGGDWSRRSDDNLETLKHRLLEYEKKTAPLVSYYERLRVLHRVSTERLPREVLQNVLQLLN